MKSIDCFSWDNILISNFYFLPLALIQLHIPFCYDLVYTLVALSVDIHGCNQRDRS
jgi:hypothetical protein